jgi:GT2 family glycosyltransferase
MMSAPPELSVCIPCLNAGPYLRARFDSLLAQTYTRFEIVVLDSFSVDGSWEIIREYAARDARIRVFQEPRRGLYPDWNACIARARHRWIYVATADDTLAPDAFAHFVSAIQNKPSARVIGSRHWPIDADGRDFPFSIKNYTRALLGCRYWTEGWCSPESEIFSCMSAINPFVSITQIIFQRSVFERTGGFIPDYGPSSDVAWQLRVIRSERVYFLPRRLGSWRRHPAQISSEQNSPRYYAQMARMARDALRIGLVPCTLPFQLAAGFAEGTTGEPVSDDLPPLARRFARWIHARPKFRRGRRRFLMVILLAFLSRALHPQGPSPTLL